MPRVPGVQATPACSEKAQPVAGLLVREKSDRTQETQSSEEGWFLGGGVVGESEGGKDIESRRGLGRRR